MAFCGCFGGGSAKPAEPPPVRAPVSSSPPAPAPAPAAPIIKPPPAPEERTPVSLLAPKAEVLTGPEPAHPSPAPVTSTPVSVEPALPAVNLSGLVQVCFKNSVWNRRETGQSITCSTPFHSAGLVAIAATNNWDNMACQVGSRDQRTRVGLRGGRGQVRSPSLVYNLGLQFQRAKLVALFTGLTAIRQGEGACTRMLRCASRSRRQHALVLKEPPLSQSQGCVGGVSPCVHDCLHTYGHFAA